MVGEKTLVIHVLITDVAVTNAWTAAAATLTSPADTTEHGPARSDRPAAAAATQDGNPHSRRCRSATDVATE